MSGGVDSSVAALLTKNMGYDCIGCIMRLYDKSENHDAESDDVRDARSVAERLSMPFYVFDYTEKFKEKVICDFVECYRAGTTPNPCVVCNRYLKFGALLDKAAELGCEKIVTGHYARIEEKDGMFCLKKAADPSKDQSYMLYSLTQEKLAHILFPLGSMTKAQAREIASENMFVNAAKHDSQDICFVPDKNYSAALERLSGVKELPGDFVSEDGRIIGRHKGISHYTVGQHKGLGIVSDEPLYVAKISPDDRVITLCTDSGLYEKCAVVADVNWIAGIPESKKIRCRVKIRYRRPEQPAELTVLDDKTVKVEFDAPERAVTPGQAAVFYDGDTVLGGGTITR